MSRLAPRLARLASTITLSLLALPPARAAETAPTTAETAASPERVCYLVPASSNARERSAVELSMEEAFERTRPAHAAHQLQAVKTRAEAERAGCRAILELIKAKDYRRKKNVRVRAEKWSQPEPLYDQQLVLELATARGEALEPAWAALWQAVAPPPPPPPPPPSPPPTPYVDQDLRAAQAEEAARAEVKTAPRAPWLSMYADLGLLARGVGDDAPGRPIEQSPALALGVSAALHLAPWVGMAARHELDLEASYNYRFLRRAEGDGAVTADRLNLGGRYRFRLPAPYLPRLGLFAGYELLRNEVGGGDPVLSVRYGVLRLGPSLAQGLLEASWGGLELFLDPGLRITPSGGALDAALGFELGGGLAARWERLLLRTRVRYAAQPLSQGDTSFSDGFFDFDVGIGFQL